MLGPDDPETLTSQNNLASAYQDAGRTAEAIRLYELNLEVRERLLGPDHPSTLTSRGNLAAAYQDAGRAAEAIPLLERTLADRERVLGPDHPDTPDLTEEPGQGLSGRGPGRRGDPAARADHGRPETSTALRSPDAQTVTERTSLAPIRPRTGLLTRSRQPGKPRPPGRASQPDGAAGQMLAGRLPSASRRSGQAGAPGRPAPASRRSGQAAASWQRRPPACQAAEPFRQPDAGPARRGPARPRDRWRRSRRKTRRALP